MEIIKIRYNDNYTTYENGIQYTIGRVGGQITHIFKSEIEYINNKPFWKGKEIYEIYNG